MDPDSEEPQADRAARQALGGRRLRRRRSVANQLQQTSCASTNVLPLIDADTQLSQSTECNQFETTVSECSFDLNTDLASTTTESAGSTSECNTTQSTEPVASSSPAPDDGQQNETTTSTPKQLPVRSESNLVQSGDRGLQSIEALKVQTGLASLVGCSSDGEDEMAGCLNVEIANNEGDNEDDKDDDYGDNDVLNDPSTNTHTINTSDMDDGHPSLANPDTNLSNNAVRVLFRGQQARLNQCRSHSMGLRADGGGSAGPANRSARAQAQNVAVVSRRLIQRQLETIQMNDSRRWNFDFRNSRPLGQVGHRYSNYSLSEPTPSQPLRSCRPLNDQNQTATTRLTSQPRWRIPTRTGDIEEHGDPKKEENDSAQ